MTDAAIEFDPIVTRRPWSEPERLFTCVYCGRDVMTNPWSNRSRGDYPVFPLCRSCEYHSGVIGVRGLPATHMDRRILTQLAVMGQAISTTAYAKIHPLRY